MIAAGNLASDRAIVNRISTAMQSRMVHLQIQLDPKMWAKWASGNNIDHRVTSFIDFRPDLLHAFDPDHNDFTFPCARTWEFVSKIIKNETVVDRSLAPDITGAIGPGAGLEFISFCSIYKELPTIKDILKDPTKVNVSDEPSVLFAITGMLANEADPNTFDKLMEYVLRMPMEFQVITMQRAFMRNPTIATCQSWEDWLDSRADDVM